MRHSDARTLARNLALDRDAAVAGGTGGTANIDVTRILNDHVSWYGVNGASDRSRAHEAASSTGYGDDYGYNYGAPGALFPVTVGSFSSLTTLTTILRVLAVTRETTGTATAGIPMELVQPADIYHARSKSVATGVPSMIAFVRLAGASNKLRAIVHPPPASTTYFAVHAQLSNPEFTVTAIDDNEVMDYPQHAQYGIVRETALDLAIILRRPDSVWDSIMTRVKPSRELTDNMAARDMAVGPPREDPK